MKKRNIWMVFLAVLSWMFLSHCGFAIQRIEAVVSPTLSELQASLTPTPNQMYPTHSVTSVILLPTISAHLEPSPILPVLEPLSLENTPVPAAAAVSLHTADSIGLLASWGGGRINVFEYSVDSAELAVGSSIGVSVFDGQELTLHAFYPAETRVTNVHYSPDGRWLAWSLANGLVEVHDAGDGGLFQTIGGDNSTFAIAAFAFEADNAHIWLLENELNSAARARFSRCSIRDGRCVEAEMLVPDSAWRYLSPDDVLAALMIYSDRENEQPLKKILPATKGDEFYYSLDMDAKGEILLADQGDVYLKFVSGEVISLTQIPGYQNPPFFAYICSIQADGLGLGPVESVAFSADGQLFALGLRAGLVQVRRVSDGTVLSSFAARAEKLSFSPDGLFLAVGLVDGGLETHYVADGTRLAHLTGYPAAYTSISFSSDSQLLAAGATDALVRVWRLSTGQRVLDLYTQAHRVAFKPNQDQLVTASDRGGIVLWDLATGDTEVLEKDMAGNGDIFRVNDIQFSRDGHWLLTGSQACFFEVWDMDRGKAVWRSINGENINPWDSAGYQPNSPVNHVALSPDGQRGMVDHREWSGILFNWQTDERWLAEEIFGPGYYITSSAYFPAGDKIVVESGIDQFSVWETEPYELVFQTQGPSYNLVVSPDGQLIASTDAAGGIYLWSASDGQSLTAWMGHHDEITQLVFSPDGRYLASSSVDGTVRIWGVVVQ